MSSYSSFKSGKLYYKDNSKDVSKDDSKDLKVLNVYFSENALSSNYKDSYNVNVRLCDISKESLPDEKIILNLNNSLKVINNYSYYGGLTKEIFIYNNEGNEIGHFDNKNDHKYTKFVTISEDDENKFEVDFELNNNLCDNLSILKGKYDGNEAYFIYDCYII